MEFPRVLVCPDLWYVVPPPPLMTLLFKVKLHTRVNQSVVASTNAKVIPIAALKNNARTTNASRHAVNAERELNVIGSQIIVPSVNVPKTILDHHIPNVVPNAMEMWTVPEENLLAFMASVKILVMVHRFFFFILCFCNLYEFPGACGIGADCNLRGLTPVCSCPRDMTGDPFVRCRPFTKEDLCTPNPCGVNAQCTPGFDKSGKERPVCTCLPGYTGNSLSSCVRVSITQKRRYDPYYNCFFSG